MAVNELLRSSSLSWLAASGKDSDVVLSSRVRLARNFKERRPCVLYKKRQYLLVYLINMIINHTLLIVKIRRVI